MSSIYFIHCEQADAVKIGFTTVGAETRLRQLDNTSMPGELRLWLELPGTQADEAALHEKFAGDRIRDNREWFRVSDDINRFVSSRAFEREAAKAIRERESFASYCSQVGWALPDRLARIEYVHDIKRLGDTAAKVLVDCFRQHQTMQFEREDLQREFDGLEIQYERLSAMHCDDEVDAA